MNSSRGNLTFPADLESLSLIRDYVKKVAKKAGLSESASYNLVLAIDEIATNVISYGYEKDHPTKDISIEAFIDDKHLTFELVDTGKPYDPNASPSINTSEMPKKEGGFGIMLAKMGVDELQYESKDGKNIHRFIVKLQPEEFEEVENDLQKLQALVNISIALGKEIQLSALLEQIVSEVTKVMKAERSTLFLVDPEHPDELVSTVAEGLSKRQIRVPFSVGIAGATARTKETINIEDAYSDSRFNPSYDKTHNFRTRSMLSTPILDKSGNLVGVVQVINKKDNKPFSKGDEQFLKALCVHFEVAITRAELVKKNMEAQAVLSTLELARKVQMDLIPKKYPALPEYKKVDIYATIIPAIEVGGDLYDYFPLDENRICFIIGDVSDKGIPAALFMASTHTAFKIIATTISESIAFAMNRLNDFLCEINSQQMFITVFAGILDLQTGQVEYVDAGHEPPFILKKDGSVQRVEKAGGYVLGLSFLKQNGLVARVLQLDPGDMLILYTDGVTEAMNSAHELFGVKRTEQAIAKVGPDFSSEKIIQTLLQNLREHVGKFHQNDDISILAIRYIG